VADVRALMAGAADVEPAFPLFIRLAAIAGGRRGELHAIRFTDIDTARNTIERRRNYVRAEGGWIEKASTRTGRARYIDIDDWTMALIAAQRVRLEAIAAAFGPPLSERRLPVLEGARRVSSLDASDDRPLVPPAVRAVRYRRVPDHRPPALHEH
jgi:integrase